MSETRRQRAEERFRCIAEPTINVAKQELKEKSRKLRHEERLARKSHNKEHAEKYREAANAVENALSELEKVEQSANTGGPE